MQSLRVFGDGECSAIAVAVARKIALAMDDLLARKNTTVRYRTVPLFNTVSLMVEAIHAGLLTAAEADAIKAAWEANHLFRHEFRSFAEVV
jgi:predicted nucleic acid-binding protein